MYKRLSAFLILVIFAIAPLQALSAGAGAGQRSTTQVKAEIDTLPPVGKGHDMVKPYQMDVPVPDWIGPDNRGGVSRDHAPTPLSRETVTPSYRYGTPGYMPDGRGGRGYDYGYPGYRNQGGGGYPHHRRFGSPR
jgi:hypothetical protein